MFKAMTKHRTTGPTFFLQTQPKIFLLKLSKSKAMAVEGTAQDTPMKGETLPEHHEQHE